MLEAGPVRLRRDGRPPWRKRYGWSRPLLFERTSPFARWRPDWLAGHIGFEPANPCASYLFGIA